MTCLSSSQLHIFRFVQIWEFIWWYCRLMHHVVQYIYQTMWGHSPEDHIMKLQLRMGLCRQEGTAGVVKCNTSLFLTYSEFPYWKSFSYLGKFIHLIWKSATSAWVPCVCAKSLYLATCTWVVMGEYCYVDLQLIFEEHLLNMYTFRNHIFLIICCTLSINSQVFHMVCFRDLFKMS
jgi:hypothetical protein